MIQLGCCLGNLFLLSLVVGAILDIELLGLTLFQHNVGGQTTEVISTPQPTRLTAIATAIIRHAIRANTLTDIVFIEFLLFI